MPSEEEWAERIRSGWLRYGTGQPLSERTVRHLAREFSKPMEWPQASVDQDAAFISDGRELRSLHTRFWGGI